MPRSGVSTSDFAEPSGGVEVVQPFVCDICSKRFTRLENLRRHSSLHKASTSKEASLQCLHCAKTFSRPDLRLRHLRRKHPHLIDAQVPSKFNKVRHSDSASEERASTSLPRSSLADHTSGIGSADRAFRPTTTEPSDLVIGHEALPLDLDHLWNSGLSQNETTILANQDNLLAKTVSPLETDPRKGAQEASDSFADLSSFELTSNTIPDVNLGVTLFFDHVSHMFPFMHRPTFDPTSAPEHLLLAMFCISLQYLDDENYGRQAAITCFTRGIKLVDELDQSMNPSQGLDLTVIQAMIMLGTYAVMFQGGTQCSNSLRMHAKSIEISRRCGLPEPLPAYSASTTDLDALWKQHLRNEEHKRTFFALYQLDCMRYQTLSIPRSLSHLEIKHDMPCTEEVWHAATASDWAHQALLESRSASSQKFIIEVRSCMQGVVLSAESRNSRGALLIVHFISTSLREVSGWSTITGKVDFERFEALHVALKAMDGHIRSLPKDSWLGMTCQAKWNMAMIELLLWSSSHTNGVVESSMDAAIAAAVHMSVHQPMTISDQAADSLLPHITWYLQYLSEGDVVRVQQESPWVTFYAFKVCLIVLQLLRAGSRAAYYDELTNLGIIEETGMIDWMEGVFKLRSKWGVGGSVIRCIRGIWCI